jgi:flagellar hook-length control protein FliK
LSIGQSVAVTPRSSFETQTPGGVDLGTNPNPVGTVGEQILDSVQASMAQGDRQIAVRLQPPELGTVTVRLREQGDHLEGTVEVGQSDTRREIERALPEVIRGLRMRGFRSAGST